MLKFILNLIAICTLTNYAYAGEIVITVTEEDGKQKTVKHAYEDDAVSEPFKDKAVSSRNDPKFIEMIEKLKKYEEAMAEIEGQMKDDLNRNQGGR